MKKQILCGALSLSLLLGSAAAFTDIADPGTQQAAAVLSALQIMQGEGGGRFNPNGQLTRAEFCKLAVTALGVQDVTAYRNYTVFPDVPSSHWASGYINAAIKQTGIREKEIIKGFADGTFGPDKTITYGEVCTMLLRMLGYTVADVGPYWPVDYIAKAEALKLNAGVANQGSGTIMKRGDAAVMLMNTLQAKPKEGDKLLMNNVAANSVEGSILLATAETNDDLRAGQAQFYESSTVITRPMADTLDRSLVGARGTVLFDKTTTSKVRAFVPESGNMETITVKSVTPTELKTADQTYKVPQKTVVVIDSEVLDYGKTYFDLPNRTLNLYYDNDHQLELISVVVADSERNAFVYGTAAAANIPQNYKVMKNGVSIDRSTLQKYDLVSINADSRTATVSDKRITGYLDDASPSYAFPQKITVLGKEFPISETAAAYFKGMKFGDKVTLLLDTYGTVQAAYPASEIEASMVGVYVGKDPKDSEKDAVELVCGVTVSGKLEKSTDTQNDPNAKLLGQLVTVRSSKDGTIYLSRDSGSGKVTGTWSVEGNTIGTNKVSPNVKIYEMVADNAPVTAISVDDIRRDSVASADIRRTILDSSGTIIGIILDDVTGNGWVYGIGSGSSEKITTEGGTLGDIVNYTNVVTLTCFVDGAAAKKTVNVISLPSGLNGAPVGIPNGMDRFGDKKVMLPTRSLTRVDTVKLESFDASEGVKTSAGYFPLQEDIGVYVSDYKKFVPLREAKANFTEFTLYADDTAANGGMIRVIIAK